MKSVVSSRLWKIPISDSELPMSRRIFQISLLLAILFIAFPDGAMAQFREEAFTQNYNDQNDTTARDSTDAAFTFKEFFGGVSHKRDCRIGVLFAGSTVFAQTAAAVLAANGIHVHIYKELMPTPMLSFAVRQLHCDAGIVVTASHNPSKYNGYKVYGSDGCQLTLDAAQRVTDYIEAHQMFDDVKTITFEEGLANGMISYIEQDVLDAYFENVLKQGIHTDLCASSGLKVVYTPLNGTGNKPVRTILKKIGITDVTVVPEQENPDGHFTTCPYT